MDVGVIIGIIGILASLIGIPVSVIIARRGRQLPDLRHVIDFDIILNPNDRLLDHGLTMKVGDHVINTISRSRVAIWNHRGDTIRGTDIVDADPFRIQFVKGDSALQVRTLTISRPQTRLMPTINTTDEASVDITFDFLDAGDGAVFEVIHQGTEKPTVLGTLRGVKIRNSGTVSLGQEALEAFRKPRFRRFIDNSPRSRILGLVLNVLIGILATLLTFAGVKQTFLYHAQLVNVKNYDLRTISGQAGFANAVTSIGNQKTAPAIVLIILFSLMALYFFASALRSFLRHSRRIIPASVVALIADDVEGGTADPLPSP